MKHFLPFALLLVSFHSFAQGPIKIYDANKMRGLGPLLKKGTLVVEDGKEIGNNVSANAIVLSEQFTKIQKYYMDIHNRNSWDDKGALIEATVNIHGLAGLMGLKQNAAWVGAQEGVPSDISNRFVFGKGKRKGLDNFEKALDVVGHEYTHAIISTTSNLDYEGQSGALNEHLADVFGILINIHFNNPALPYLIGHTVLPNYTSHSKGLRDMENPEKGLSVQPGHMDDLKTAKFKKYDEGCMATSENDHCGVHILSGIPNKMAVFIIKKVSADEASALFYNVMTKRLNSKSNFKDYRLALLEECKEMSQNVCVAVELALKEVGL